jgi:hypothetical protein
MWQSTIDLPHIEIILVFIKKQFASCNGRCLLARIMPYCTLENRIDGVIRRRRLPNRQLKGHNFESNTQTSPRCCRNGILYGSI